MASCLICSGQIEPFLDFGRMPIANGFLTQEEFANEYFFSLRAGFCSQCKMVQLTERVDPAKMFHDQYAFFSSTSRRMAQHFEIFAKEALGRISGEEDPFVVEIGSNDGIMLRHFAAAGLRHLGVEPSANVAQVAMGKGVETHVGFFDEKTAEWIRSEHGPANLLLGANVMCHIPDLHSVAAGAKKLLTNDGLLIFEDPYLGDILSQAAYDQIYDEHVFYFSLHALEYLFGKHDLEIVDVQHQEVHGGSMRYFIGHRGVHSPSGAVKELRELERLSRFEWPDRYDNFRVQVERSREALIKQLHELKASGKRVVGYAATSKSTTVTNYCGITGEMVEFISDTTPIKQGKFSPGMHLPVKPHAEFQRNYPHVALLFGWNHAEEIMANERAFQDAGGRWLVYVPEVKFIP